MGKRMGLIRAGVLIFAMLLSFALSLFEATPAHAAPSSSRFSSKDFSYNDHDNGRHGGQKLTFSGSRGSCVVSYTLTLRLDETAAPTPRCGTEASGAKFLGWSSSSDATVADFPGGYVFHESPDTHRGSSTQNGTGTNAARDNAPELVTKALSDVAQRLLFGSRRSGVSVDPEVHVESTFGQTLGESTSKEPSEDADTSSEDSTPVDSGDDAAKSEKEPFENMHVEPGAAGVEQDPEHNQIARKAGPLAIAASVVFFGVAIVFFPASAGAGAGAAGGSQLSALSKMLKFLHR